ncbi:MAG: hypothetical protein HZA17_04780 [Nitrospirae bacterium]|nr:hypothetical protein [Nitrospirota bacterium]
MTNRFFRNHVLIIALILAMGFVYGCGSSSKEGGTHVTVSGPDLAGVDVCLNCHPNQKLDWEVSGHANLNAVPALSIIGNIGESPCRTCHDPQGDGLKVAGILGGNFDPRPVNGCETCHGNGGNHFGLGPIDKYRAAASANGSSQFNTCTACHQLPGASGTAVTTFHVDGPRIITDTHIGTTGNWPGGSGANTKDITGYALKPLDEQACAICHNPHKADATINRQWAASRHGDKTAAGAWAHYNWSRGDRASCQRCHTTSGIIAYTNSQKNGTTYTPPLAQNDSWIPEMLQCNGCHSNNKGALRNPGQITETYADNAVQQYPDISNSNLCLDCHVGRESGGSVSAKAGSWNSMSFVNSHYLTAGGTLFARTGYGFAGRSYANVSFFQHDKIGLTADRTGTQGPCIACHMAFNVNGEKHTFLPLSVERKDPAEPNKITKVLAIRSALCQVCHEGAYEITVTEFEEQKTLLHEAMEAFDAQLQQRGYFWAGANPYFFRSAGNTTSGNAVRNWLSPGDADLTGNTTGKNNMGAAFNFNLIEHDPGAFVHNRYYVKRLIYDSIDWLDDNLLNNSVAATLDSALHAGKTYQAGAKAYILSSGGRP